MFCVIWLEVLLRHPFSHKDQGTDAVGISDLVSTVQDYCMDMKGIQVVDDVECLTSMLKENHHQFQHRHHERQVHREEFQGEKIFVS